MKAALLTTPLLLLLGCVGAALEGEALWELAYRQKARLGRKHSPGEYVTGEDFLAEERARLRFSEWAGKEGLLKPGFPFNPKEHAELLDFNIWSDRREVRERPFPHAVREVSLLRGKEEVEIRISVVPSSTDDAQELLLASLQAGRGNLGGFPWRTGPELGDASFVADFDKVADLRELRFVRNNVFIHLRKSPESSPDLVRFATDMDSRIQAAPSLTPIDLVKEIPVMTRFEIAGRSVSTYSSTPLTLRHEVPDKREVEVLITSNLGRVEAGKGDHAWEFHSGYDRGKATVRAICLTDALLFAIAEVLVEIR